MLDAMRHMVTQNFPFNAAKRGTHGGDLRHDVDAVAVVFDHTRKAAHLSLDPLQALSY